MTPEEREIFIRNSDHLSEGNIVMRELRDAIQSMPERFSVIIPPPQPARLSPSALVAVGVVTLFCSGFGACAGAGYVLATKRVEVVAVAK